MRANSKLMDTFMKNIFYTEGYFEQKKLFHKNYLRQDRTPFLIYGKSFIKDRSQNIKQKAKAIEIINYSLSIKNELLFNLFLSSNLWTLIKKIAKATSNEKYKGKVDEMLGVGDDSEKKKLAKEFCQKVIESALEWGDEYPKDLETGEVSKFAKLKKYIEKSGKRKEVEEKNNNNLEQEEYEDIDYHPIESKIDENLGAKEYFLEAIRVYEEEIKKQLKFTITEEPANTEKMFLLFNQMDDISTALSDPDKMTELFQDSDNQSEEILNKVLYQNEEIQRVKQEFSQVAFDEGALVALRLKYNVKVRQDNDQDLEVEEEEEIIPEPSGPLRSEMHEGPSVFEENEEVVEEKEEKTDDMMEEGSSVNLTSRVRVLVKPGEMMSEKVFLEKKEKEEIVENLPVEEKSVFEESKADEEEDKEKKKSLKEIKKRMMKAVRRKMMIDKLTKKRKEKKKKENKKLLLEGKNLRDEIKSKLKNL